MSPRTGRPVRSRTATAKTSKGNTAKDVEARPRKAARKETTKATDATATGAVTAAAQQNKQSLSAAIIEQKNENTNIVSEATFITSSPRPVSRRKDLDKRSLKRAETESEQQDHDQDLLPLESNDENDAAQLVSFTDTVRTSNGAFALDENNVETVINDAGNQHETHMNDEAMEEILSAESITGTFYNEEAMGENGDARRQSIFQAIFSPAFKLLKKMPYVHQIKCN
ncbi:hypothetical protein BDF19DRAFT_22236 [Syncephalis fuscata]|nr:hypothetical protein BDF19DRAFT_22236 [Syncephalis fuscata]